MTLLLFYYFFNALTELTLKNSGILNKSEKIVAWIDAINAISQPRHFIIEEHILTGQQR